ncbi:MAG TPA: Na(+)-translocating NADH-quinone reductase subunit A, partial [Lutibacter sp.]|nr:Na(+)-translocating NADH-quinone reductase subunit A [Lutibacter sp.]
MSKDIHIKKGLDIKLKGEAEKFTENAITSDVYTLIPEDFHSIIPKLSVKVGAQLKAGEAVFYNKANEEMKFPSPVSGEVLDIIRGEKRKILAIKIKADTQQQFVDFGVKDPKAMMADEIISHLLASGCWPFIKQRPYDVIANPANTPKAIFVSAYASAPLAADYDYVLAGKEKELQAAITALSKLTSGEVHVSIGKNANSPFAGLNNINLHKVSGPHPSGNVGTQINKISPVNKGETVWTINPQDLVIIGELFLTGKFNAERIVALAGSSVEAPKYYKTKIGSTITSLVQGKIKGNNNRIISGNVLTGKAKNIKENLGYYDNIITVIPEGNDYEL